MPELQLRAKSCAQGSSKEEINPVEVQADRDKASAPARPKDMGLGRGFGGSNTSGWKNRYHTRPGATIDLSCPSSDQGRGSRHQICYRCSVARSKSRQILQEAQVLGQGQLYDDRETPRKEGDGCRKLQIGATVVPTTPRDPGRDFSQCPAGPLVQHDTS